jgi:hypothetical protein
VKAPAAIDGNATSTVLASLRKGADGHARGNRPIAALTLRFSSVEAAQASSDAKRVSRVSRQGRARSRLRIAVTALMDEQGLDGLVYPTGAIRRGSSAI